MGIEKEKKLNLKELKEKRIEELVQNSKTNILRSIIGPFGLSPAMFNDIEGGNVTTLKNFKEGIVSDENDRKSYEAWRSSIERGVDRENFEKGFSKIRKEKFNQEEVIKDGYSGDELPKNGQTHLDHVESVSSYKKDPRVNLYMSEDEASTAANSEENLTFTKSSINQSKSDKDLKEWANDQQKEKHSLKDDLINEKSKNAKDHKERMILEAKIKKDLKDLSKSTVTESLKMGSRAALGMLFVDITNVMFIEVRDHFQENNSNDCLEIRLTRASNKIIGNKDKYIAVFKDGSLSGALSNLVTYAINHFVKTAKNMVRIIREGFLSLVRAIKMLIYPPDNMSVDEAFRESMKVFSAAIVTSIGIGFEEVLSTMLTNLGLPFSREISLFITGLTVGLGSSVLIYMIDTILDSIENPYELNCLNLLLENGDMQVKTLDGMNDVLLSINKSVLVNHERNKASVNTLSELETSTLSISDIREKLIKIQNKEKKILNKIKGGSGE